MLVLGIVGGGLISRNLLARLDSINRTSREIMAGDLSRRVPVTRAGDEFDALAQNLNRMLDRTERLMRGHARRDRFDRARSAHAAQPPAQPAREHARRNSSPRASKAGRSKPPSARPTG